MEDAVCAIRDSLVTEHTTRTNNADRGLLMVHSTHLNRRGVGTQHHIFGVGLRRSLLHEECILHIACGVLQGEVQSREYVPVVLDFGALGYGVTHTREDLYNLILYNRDGVTCAICLGRARASHIAHCGQLCGSRVGKRCLQCVHTLGGSLLQGVDFLTQLALLLCWYTLKLLHQGCKFALLAEYFDTELLNLSRCGG